MSWRLVLDERLLSGLRPLIAIPYRVMRSYPLTFLRWVNVYLASKEVLGGAMIACISCDTGARGIGGSQA
jgi:hypothetical protein